MRGVGCEMRGARCEVWEFENGLMMWVACKVVKLMSREGVSYEL